MIALLGVPFSRVMLTWFVSLPAWVVWLGKAVAAPRFRWLRPRKSRTWWTRASSSPGSCPTTTASALLALRASPRRRLTGGHVRVRSEDNEPAGYTLEEMTPELVHYGKADPTTLQPYVRGRPVPQAKVWFRLLG